MNLQGSCRIGRKSSERFGVFELRWGFSCVVGVGFGTLLDFVYATLYLGPIAIGWWRHTPLGKLADPTPQEFP